LILDEHIKIGSTIKQYSEWLELSDEQFKELDPKAELLLPHKPAIIAAAEAHGCQKS
jgi:hypothetical protein